MVTEKSPQSFIDMELFKVYHDSEFDNRKSAVVRGFLDNDYLWATGKTPLEIYFLSKDCLEKKGYYPISLRDNAYLRISEGMGSFATLNSNWTKESVIILSNKEVYLTKETRPIVRPGKKEIEEILADSVRCKQTNNYGNPFRYEIPSNRLGEDKLTSYLLSDAADPYGRFLFENGFETLSIDFSDGGDGIRILPLVLHGFKKNPNKFCNYKYYKGDPDIDLNWTAFVLRGISS